jgi:hypothetical protein
MTTGRQLVVRTAQAGVCRHWEGHHHDDWQVAWPKPARVGICILGALVLSSTPVRWPVALQTSCTDVGGSGDPSLLSLSGALARAMTRGSQGSRSTATPA